MGPAPQIRALSAHTPGCRLLPRVGEAGTGLGEVYVCSGRGTVCILQLPLLVQLYKPVGIVTFLKKKKNPDSKVSLIDFSPSLPPLKTTKKRNKKKILFIKDFNHHCNRSERVFLSGERESKRGRRLFQMLH